MGAGDGTLSKASAVIHGVDVLLVVYLARVHLPEPRLGGVRLPEALQVLGSGGTLVGLGRIRVRLRVNAHGSGHF